MKNITLTVNKAYVYDEVAKTTAYAGAKMMAEDATAYERIFTTDEDRLLLERFWVETCNIVTNQLKPFINSVESQPISHGVDLMRNYNVELELSSSFDDNLTEAISTSLFSFFVASIVSKWFIFANKPEAESFTIGAAGIMDDIMRKIYYKKRVSRASIGL
jgi:hypothetical protein